METFFLNNEDIFKFYERVAQEFELFVPVRIKTPQKVKCDYGFSLPADDYILKRYSDVNKEDIVFNEYRSIEPFSRNFFTHFKEEVCEYFMVQESMLLRSTGKTFPIPLRKSPRVIAEGDFLEEEEKKRKEKPIAICGVKNCDLFSSKIQDFVFLGGNEQDPNYREKRENALIISGDCPSFKEVCFCRAFDINPHVTENFDFNLSPLNNGYLVDVGSPRAQKIAESIKNILSAASVGQLSGRTAKRSSVIQRMEEHLFHHKIPKKESLQEIVLAGYNSGIWLEQMKTCVECAGCIFICDTCHCFLLADDKTGEDSKRLRVWDGCLLKNFTKVAGGANPLKMRYMRLRNRYLKKFDFFIDNIGFQACCGCGRCIEACPGKIDIRYILRKLYEEKYLPAA
jgi:formate hydrogenlyase subunit 6/NADH:ubiquinone oxidoreductase subunit I